MGIWGVTLGILCVLVLRGGSEEGGSRLYMEACAKQELFASAPPLNFTCSNKLPGGYYADIESGCHIFHLCAPSNIAVLTDHQFCCHPELVFDQRFLVCDRPENVECWSSELYYDDQFPASVRSAGKERAAVSEESSVQDDESRRQSRGNDDSTDKSVSDEKTTLRVEPPPSPQRDKGSAPTHAPGKTITLPPAFRQP